jgi:hypothetical protein
MTIAKPASGKAIKFMSDLMRERDPQGMLNLMPEAWRITYRDLEKVLADMKVAGYEPESMNVWLVANHRPQLLQSDCSKLIDNLLKCPKNDAHSVLPKTETNVMATAVAASEPVEDGVYKVGDTIYKVKHAQQSGKQWAHRLTVVNDELTKGGHVAAVFRYAGKPATFGIKPEHKLTYEDAKAFGALYGMCCCCGRLLTNELSIALGIGPVCGKRQFGGEFNMMIVEAQLKVQPASEQVHRYDENCTECVDLER